MNPVSRRGFLGRAAALGLTGATLPLAACPPAEDSGLPDDGLPRYQWDGPLGPEAAFEHGVASGDPLTEAVILWTRVTGGSPGEELEVFVEVADAPDFRVRRLAWTVTTTAERDWTVKVDATGLPAGTTFYYRFSALGRTSPVGRTRTLPDGPTAHVRLAVVACSNYGYGYFHAYRHLAARPDLDVVIHLGDYIYEYAMDGYGETYGEFRDLEPPTEMIALADYRLRYSWYRRDADQAEMHRQNPMIHVWDDHEFACDPYVYGAVNHQDGEGDWTGRIEAALQAYDEWMPTRLGTQGRIFRTFRFGDLVTLTMVDRQRRYLWPADEDAGEYLGAEQQAWLDTEAAAVTTPWLVLGQGTTFAPRSEDGLSGGWDAPSRERLLDHVPAGTGLVVLTGDIHRFEALDVVADPDAYDPGTGAGSAGVELVCGSISSPGGNGTKAPQTFYTNGLDRGYLIVDLTADRCHADFYGFIDPWKFNEELPAEGHLAAFAAAAGANHLETAVTPVPTSTSAPALAP